MQASKRPMPFAGTGDRNEQQAGPSKKARRAALVGVEDGVEAALGRLVDRQDAKPSSTKTSGGARRIVESPKHEIIHPGVAKPEGAFSYGDEKEPETHYYDADEGGAGGYGQQGNADVVDQNDNGKAERQPSAPSAGGDRNQYQDENDVRIGNLEEQEDLCEALVAELDEQSKPKRPSGANREGLRDYVVLRSGYTACDDPEAAFDEATRLANAAAIRAAIDIIHHQSPKIDTAALDVPAASKLADLIATGRAPAAASRKSVSQAFSPCAGDVLFAILDSIRTADLRPAVENFLVETCKRVSVPADQGRETDTISTIFSLMQKQVSQACEGLGIEPEVAQTVLDKMIPSKGPLDAPIGRISNYPPTSALTAGHKSGINPNTWTGQRITQKSGGNVEGFFCDLQSFAAPPAQDGPLLARHRSMADPALDELDSRLGPVVHRIAWDAGLLKIRSRLLAGTTNLAAGAQACDSFENVASELNIFEGFSLEIVKCEIKVAKVENDHGNFGEAKVQFQALIIFSESAVGKQVLSLSLLGPQWCSGWVGSTKSTSPKAYRRAALTDALENFINALQTGDFAGTGPFRSLFAADCVPRETSQQMPQSTLDTLLARNFLRADELETGEIYALKDLPLDVVAMGVRRGDLAPDLDPATDRIGGKSILAHLCSRTGQRTAETRRTTKVEYEGKMMTIDAMLGLKGGKTRTSTTVWYEGKEMTLAAAGSLKAAKTRATSMAEHEGKMLTIDAVVGIKGRETRATRTGLYEGQLITVLAMIGLKGKITRATRTTDYNGQTMTITAATGLKGKATRMTRMTDYQGQQMTVARATGFKGNATRASKIVEYNGESMTMLEKSGRKGAHTRATKKVKQGNEEMTVAQAAGKKSRSTKRLQQHKLASGEIVDGYGKTEEKKRKIMAETRHILTDAGDGRLLPKYQAKSRMRVATLGYNDWRRCSEHIDEFMDRFVVEKTIDDATKRVLDWSAIGAELTELGFMNWDVLSDSGKWGTGRYRIRGFLKAIRGADWEENL